MKKKDNNKIEETSTETVSAQTETKENLTKTQIINREKIAHPDINIEKEDKDVNFHDLIENKRKTLFANYQKNRRVNNIIMVVEVLFVIASFILIVQNNQAMRISGFVILFVFLGGLVAYYAITKNRFPNETKKYIADISLDLDRHLFNDDRYKEMVTNLDTKLEMTEITADRVYSSPSDIGSRNICEGHFGEMRFKAAELALYKQVDRKKRDVVFVGRYLSFENSLKFDGRLIVNLKGEKNLDLPTDIEDLKILKEEDNMTIYGSENFDINSVLSKKALSAIKNINVKDFLVNVNIVLWGGHTAVYLSYDDIVVSLPFDKEFKEEPINAVRKDFLNIFSIFSEK